MLLRITILNTRQDGGPGKSCCYGLTVEDSVARRWYASIGTGHVASQHCPPTSHHDPFMQQAPVCLLDCSCNNMHTSHQSNSQCYVLARSNAKVTWPLQGHLINCCTILFVSLSLRTLLMPASENFPCSVIEYQYLHVNRRLYGNSQPPCPPISQCHATFSNCLLRL